MTDNPTAPSDLAKRIAEAILDAGCVEVFDTQGLIAAISTAGLAELEAECSAAVDGCLATEASYRDLEARLAAAEQRYETSHRCRLHAERALEAAERERDEARHAAGLALSCHPDLCPMCRERIHKVIDDSLATEGGVMVDDVDRHLGEAAIESTEVVLCQEIADLRQQLEEANTEATMYKAMVCSQSCKMHYPPPDGEPLPWDDLESRLAAAENSEALWEKAAERLKRERDQLMRAVSRFVGSDDNGQEMYNELFVVWTRLATEGGE